MIAVAFARSPKNDYDLTSYDHQYELENVNPNMSTRVEIFGKIFTVIDKIAKFLKQIRRFVQKIQREIKKIFKWK
jgi:hypothetical protein